MLKAAQQTDSSTEMLWVFKDLVVEQNWSLYLK